MMNEASPRPWRVDESIGGWKACVSDANGNPVASCWGRGPTEQQEKAEAIAALIVVAVNERERLRDIVRRLESEMERCHRRDGGISQELMDAVYEARAAIGEDNIHV